MRSTMIRLLTFIRCSVAQTRAASCTHSCASFPSNLSWIVPGAFNTLIRSIRSPDPFPARPALAPFAKACLSQDFVQHGRVIDTQREDLPTTGQLLHDCNAVHDRVRLSSLLRSASWFGIRHLPCQIKSTKTLKANPLISHEFLLRARRHRLASAKACCAERFGRVPVGQTFWQIARQIADADGER